MHKTPITLAAALLLAAAPAATVQAQTRNVLRAAVPVVTCPTDRPDTGSPYNYTNATAGAVRLGRDPFAMAFCSLPDSLIAKAPAKPALMLSWRDFSIEGGKLEARMYRKRLDTSANELIAVLPSTPSSGIRLGKVAIDAAFLPLDTTQYVYWVSVAVQGGSAAPNEAHLVGLGE